MPRRYRRLAARQAALSKRKKGKRRPFDKDPSVGPSIAVPQPASLESPPDAQEEGEFEEEIEDVAEAEEVVDSSVAPEAARHLYIVRELKKIGLFSGAMVLILVILSFIL